MNWALGIVFIFTVVFLVSRYAKKKWNRKLKREIIQNWGNPKKGEHFNFNLIGRYFKNNTHKESAFHLISESTKDDLDIDDVFKYLDRTSSKIGQQYLYFKLRTIGSPTDLNRFDSLVKIFENDKDLSITCQQNLYALNSNDAYDLEELINGEQLKKPKTLSLSYALSIGALLCMGL
ncbi:MAG: DNA mismatch repair protein MutS, partial [Bacteroidota bacterium]